MARARAQDCQRRSKNASVFRRENTSMMLARRPRIGGRLFRYQAWVGLSAGVFALLNALSDGFGDVLVHGREPMPLPTKVTSGSREDFWLGAQNCCAPLIWRAFMPSLRVTRSIDWMPLVPANRLWVALQVKRRIPRKIQRNQRALADDGSPPRGRMA
jgi:hypothetical protein